MIKIQLSLSLLLIWLSIEVTAQYSTTTLQNLPEAISNNAVSGYLDDTEQFVYTFGGIDASKTASGIHNRCYKYNAAFDTWIPMPNLPQSPTRIAAAASTIKDTIYIIGGYHVFSNGNEQSSNLVHRFQVMADTFLSNGTPIPKATDDHIQAVYKDSLIFVVSGWSQTANIPNVQIYNPQLDTWLIGTSLPNTHEYKSFGASGAIIGDTIYYFGGARMGSNFPIQNQLRKGYINPNNVIDITWTIDTIHTDLVGYRMASFPDNHTIRWIGGSNATYNYNGIGYAGNIPVNPNRRILTYYPITNTWDTTSLPEINMDFRGIAAFNNNIILVGGMDTNQTVSNRTLQINFTPNSVKDISTIDLKIYPNPSSNIITIEWDKNENPRSIEIYSMEGKRMFTMNRISQGLVTIPITTFINGQYIVRIQFESEVSTTHFNVLK